MTVQRLIEARDQLLGIAYRQFESCEDVVGLFLAGSLAAGCQDAYSDIDLRVVVRPERHQWFVEHRPRHALPVRILLDRNGAIERMVKASVSI